MSIAMLVGIAFVCAATVLLAMGAPVIMCLIMYAIAAIMFIVQLLLKRKSKKKIKL